MKIAILGYGKMGKLIESIALQRGHEVDLKISSKNQHEFNEDNFKEIDVAIDFSVPSAGYDNVARCIEYKTNIVSGTTGWIDRLPDIEAQSEAQNVGLIYASNFSLGVNLFFALNDHLAKIMAPYMDQYSIEMEEIHHTSKKDAPSGTGITLAQQIIRHTNYTTWANSPTADSNTLPLLSKRIDPAPGTHSIKYRSDIDTIRIEHIAHSREGFALGAVIAAEYIQGKKGVHTMKDVLNLKFV